MRILALDLATRTGWSLGENGKLIESGVQTFDVKRGESPGMRFLRARKWFVEMMNTQVDLVVYEQAHHRGGPATECCVGLVTHLLGVCAEFGVNHSSVHSASLKKFALGKGRGEKSEMIEAAKRRWPGVQIIDDNHADSLLLLSHAFEAVV